MSIAANGSGPPASVIPAPSRQALAHIPGDDGWPIVGTTLRILADPQGFSHRAAAKYGPVYRTRLFGEWNVTLVGPEANDFVLTDAQSVFSSELGWSRMLGQLFPRGLMSLDFDEHRLHRRALAAAFNAGSMSSYLAQLNAGIGARVMEWRAAPGLMLAYPAIKQLTLDIAATSFLGESIGGERGAVMRAFIQMMDAAVSLIRSPLPFTSMRRGLEAREFIVDYFSHQIPLRRARGGDDLFSRLCRAVLDDGTLLPTHAVVDHISFFMLAAHDTVTSALTSFVYFLAAYPDWQTRLHGEVERLGLAPGDALPFDKLNAMPLTEMVFNEVMRINPPVPSVRRRAVRDFDFKGFRIPRGTNVSINPLHTHHMADIWPEPKRFEPRRFTPASPPRPRGAYAPFGGGAHACLGQAFAHMQAKCFARHLLANLWISVEPDYEPEWRIWPTRKPKDGMRLTVAPVR
jgi:cytochrome P450